MALRLGVGHRRPVRGKNSPGGQRERPQRKLVEKPRPGTEAPRGAGAGAPHAVVLGAAGDRPLEGDSTQSWQRAASSGHWRQEVGGEKAPALAKPAPGKLAAEAGTAGRAARAPPRALGGADRSPRPTDPPREPAAWTGPACLPQLGAGSHLWQTLGPGAARVPSPVGPSSSGPGHSLPASLRGRWGVRVVGLGTRPSPKAAASWLGGTRPQDSQEERPGVSAAHRARTAAGSPWAGRTSPGP